MVKVERPAGEELDTESVVNVHHNMKTDEIELERNIK